MTISQPHLEIYYSCKICNESISKELYEQKENSNGNDSPEELDIWQVRTGFFGDDN